MNAMANFRHEKRVVITGLGAVTPLGLSVDALWRNLTTGHSGIRPMTLCDPSEYACKISGEVPGFDPAKFLSPKDSRRMARFSQLAVAASNMAIEDAGLDLENTNRDLLGVYLGNGNGSLPTIESEMRVLMNRGGMRITPFFFPMMLPNMAAAAVSRIIGAKGYNSTVSTACAASTQAIGEAVEVIRRGRANVMIAGGAEASISQLGLAAFSVMHALSASNDEPTKASRPFDARRDGFVPSEGAGILVLESMEHAIDRGARILAEIIGYGVSADAYHPVQPDEDGTGASKAMKWAIHDAHIELNEVDYINAHGTSTSLNDISETRAIKHAFGDLAYKVPVSSTKSMLGHTLGAAGGIESIVCVKTILESLIHPTINYEFPDPECDLDYVPNEARKKNVHVALSNSFGFGGQNACLVFSNFTE